jgi:hypothetical protein
MVLYLESNLNGLAVVGSLPIPIQPWAQPQEALSIASYHPKKSLAEYPTTLAPPLLNKPSSSTALRKAAYAEHDRTRSMDPGALDFAEEGDEEEEEDNDDEHSKVEADLGERGRKWALKILQTRSELPEAGMWRSLA